MKEPVERVEDSLGKMLLRNLLGGIAWGVGVTIGATLLLAIIGYFISQANYVPVIGNFVNQIVEFVEDNNPQVDNLNELEQ